VDALTRIPSTLLVRAGALVAVLTVAAACSSTTRTAGTTPAATGTAPAAAGTAPVAVRVVATAGAPGTYLTDGAGRALYEFASDGLDRSTCTGSCLAYWPALVSAGTPTAGSGVAAGKLTVFTRPDGARQVGYAGHPLYYFAQDHAAGDVHGQGSSAFGARWWLLAPSGSPITSTPSGSASSGAVSSGGSSSGGYTGGGYGRG